MIGGIFCWSIHITDVFEHCNFTKYDPSSFDAEAQEKISILETASFAETRVIDSSKIKSLILPVTIAKLDRFPAINTL